MICGQNKGMAGQRQPPDHTKLGEPNRSFLPKLVNFYHSFADNTSTNSEQ